MIRSIAQNLDRQNAGLRSSPRRASETEVLVTSTVRDLTAGAQLAFEDRGLHELKGVPESRQLFAVVETPRSGL